MTADTFTESVVEGAGLGRLERPGYGLVCSLGITRGEPKVERADYGAVVLERQLCDEPVQLILGL